ncbi:hypothetical protein [Spirochaeta isovalerica]|uniref:Uncharacterized protein n=1 Tax=Spirochaeta isovalerica TaxID=150 RepID=A0A841RDC4_9SPIO|nr:hypothetical protein [Spirochaeta isovalerica]MBB6480990.1 hypothetical protein [Spirochaeta isovalerica]
MKMNLQKLKEAEQQFLSRYPGGFGNPEMVVISRKHKPEKMKTLTEESFLPDFFEDPSLIVENMIKVVTRSSMVSVFEKPKFRDYARMISSDEKALLSRGLYERLYGDEAGGFEMMLEILKLGKLAKWTLMTVIPVYFSPHKEVFIKPTTAKNVIGFFEVEDLVYKPYPTWDFYRGFRDLIGEMKDQVSDSLSPTNAAFTGFLMMSSGL